MQGDLFGGSREPWLAATRRDYPTTLTTRTSALSRSARDVNSQTNRRAGDELVACSATWNSEDHMLRSTEAANVIHIASLLKGRRVHRELASFYRKYGVDKELDCEKL